MDLLNLIWTNGLSFIFILSVVVFIHEMGHYVVARYNGVRVDVFSIGFGREIFGWNDRAGTRWKVSLVPLGGYVKMFGDADATSMPGDDVPKMTPQERAVSFHHKRLGQRTAIVLAGPLANFVLAVVIFAVQFATLGQPIVPSEVPAEISMIAAGSAAEEAGFVLGDRVVRIDGKQIERFEDMQKIVRVSANNLLVIVVLRDGVEVILEAIPRPTETTDSLGDQRVIGLLGVTASGVKMLRRGPLDAVGAAVEETAGLTVRMLQLLGKVIVGEQSFKELGGPVLIAQISGQVAERGMGTVFWFMALLSVNLGLINLFPIPVLDGGHLLYYAFEAIRGKPLGPRAQEYGFRLGLAMVLTLMVVVTWNDIVRWGFVDFLVGLFS